MPCHCTLCNDLFTDNSAKCELSGDKLIPEENSVKSSFQQLYDQFQQEQAAFEISYFKYTVNLGLFFTEKIFFLNFQYIKIVKFQSIIYLYYSKFDHNSISENRLQLSVIERKLNQKYDGKMLNFHLKPV